jgi:acetyl-CoA C-acetyltransferase
VALGYQALLNGDSEIVVAGGQESMSMAPHAQYLRGGVKMGDLEFVDTMIKDGLWDAFNGYHMGNTAENVAGNTRSRARSRTSSRCTRRTRPRPRRRPASSRTRSSRSPSSPARATSSSPTDEYPRHGATIEAMAKLKPAFEKDGTVTAGSASGINDGAAAVVLMTAKQAAKEARVKPLAASCRGPGRRRSQDHGHRPDPGLAQGAEEGRLEASAISI